MSAITITENLTIECVGALRERLGEALAEALLQRGGAALTLELGEVAECDGAGLQLLLAFGHAAAQAGRRVVLRHLPPGLDEVLLQFGLDQRFEREARP
jgi:anti-anti-sigma regulatory factor